MAHVEELRQIHADINAMDTIIKQAEESRRLSQVLNVHTFSQPYLPMYTPFILIFLSNLAPQPVFLHPALIPVPSPISYMV